MTASVIPILLDSSEESVGSHVPQVILFCVIPAIIPVIHVVPAEAPIVPADPLVALEVGAVFVTSRARVLDLVDYSSSSASDPSEDSLTLAPELPLVSPFLCSDDSKADSKSEPAEQRPERHESLAVHDAMVSRIRRRPTILIRPGEAIPFGRPYRTHPNRQRKLLTARKRVGPFPAHRLAWRRISYRSSNQHSSLYFTSDSSSSGSSSDSSLDTFSVGLSPGYDSTIEAFRRWRSAPLFTPYPLTMSESSLDSSFERSFDSSLLSAGPSRKRCKSPTTSVPSSTLVSILIAPTHVDLLPPRKRFRDSYSPEDSREEHMEIGTANAEAVADLGICDRVRVDTEDGIGMGVEIAASDIREDEEQFETAHR
ncbi:hypothetical protein Tco_0352341 [Tanacetum coccineum]